MSLRIRRGSESERTGIRFDQGEIVWVSSSTTSRPAYKLYVGDGVTIGGRDILETSAGNKLAYNSTTGRLDVSGLTTDDIAAGINNKFFTSELAQAATAALFSSGIHAGISFTYDDLNNRINATVTATGGGGGGSGITALVEDPSPALGGGLNLASQSIFGTGFIDINGNITTSADLIVNGGLGANLDLQAHDIIGNGTINIIGDIYTSGIIAAESGLGSNLGLNNHQINGSGTIDINGNISAGNLILTGVITATDGLGAPLNLNNQNIVGTGNLIIDGNITSTSGNLASSNFSLVGNRITGVNNTINFGSDTNKNNLYITADENTPGVVIRTKLSGTGLGQGCPILQFLSSNGTTAAPTPLVLGDSVGQIAFEGIVNGGSLGVISGRIASIVAVVESAGDTVSNFATAKIQFRLANSGGPIDPANGRFAEYSSSGAFTAPAIQPGVYANSVARDAILDAPVAGMMVFNAGLQKFQGYVSDTGLANGGAPNSLPGWINLH